MRADADVDRFDQANLKPSDVVLEVGPGTGNLTVRILQLCKRVVAVEMDPRMAAEVQKRVLGKWVVVSHNWVDCGIDEMLWDRPEQKKLELMVGDFVKAELPYFDVCISNTPYQAGRAILALGVGLMWLPILAYASRRPSHLIRLVLSLRSPRPSSSSSFLTGR